ncbi:hypothetical protein BH20ACT4_BH20ACT4_03860 [soil metagenome]
MTVTRRSDSVVIEGVLDPLGGELVGTAMYTAAEQLSLDRGTALTERHAAGLVAIARCFLA